MTLLSSSELTDIKGIIEEIVEDTSINTTFKYRQWTGDDYYDTQEQTIRNPYTDWSGVSALKGLAVKDDPNIDSDIQVGTVKFVIMQSAVSNTVTLSDLIVESGTTYNIMKIATDPLGIVYNFYCKAGM
jgi:hypothetical protein